MAATPRVCPGEKRQKIMALRHKRRMNRDGGARKAGRVMWLTNGGAIVLRQREVQEPMLMRAEIPGQVVWPGMRRAPPALPQWARPEKTDLFRPVAGNREIFTQGNER